MKTPTQSTPEVRPGWGVVEASSPELRATLEWLVGELNKPEALAEFRGEIAAGQQAIAASRAQRDRQDTEDELRFWVQAREPKRRRARRQALIDRLLKDATQP